MTHRASSLFLLLCLTLLTACTDRKSETLRLGTNVWPGYEPLYLARELGYLKDEKVHLVEYSSASQVLQSYRNGLIDAAAVTLDEAMLLLETGETPKIVLTTDISNGGDAVVGQHNISSLLDLHGKRVGVEGNALGAYMITRALEIAGIEKHSISIVQKNAAEHEKVFLENKVDAVVTFDPIRSKLLAAGGKQLFDSSQIPGEIVDVLIVRQEYIAKYPSVVQHLVDAWNHAVRDIGLKPRDTALILGKRMHLDVEQTLEVYKRISLPDESNNFKLIFQQPTPELKATAHKLSKLMVEYNLLNRKVDPEVLFLEKSIHALNAK